MKYLLTTICIIVSQLVTFGQDIRYKRVISFINDSLNPKYDSKVIVVDKIRYPLEWEDVHGIKDCSIEYRKLILAITQGTNTGLGESIKDYLPKSRKKRKNYKRIQISNIVSYERFWMVRLSIINNRNECSETFMLVFIDDKIDCINYRKWFNCY